MRQLRENAIRVTRLASTYRFGKRENIWKMLDGRGVRKGLIETTKVSIQIQNSVSEPDTKR